MVIPGHKKKISKLRNGLSVLAICWREDEWIQEEKDTLENALKGPHWEQQESKIPLSSDCLHKQEPNF